MNISSAMHDMNKSQTAGNGNSAFEFTFDIICKSPQALIENVVMPILYRNEAVVCKVLPNETIKQILSYLSFFERNSNNVALISKQFHKIAQPQRLILNSYLWFSYHKIYNFIQSSFHRLTTPAMLGIHYELTLEQVFHINFKYDAINYLDIRKVIVDDDYIESGESRNWSELPLTSTEVIFAEEIVDNSGYFFTSTCSGKIASISNNLNEELKYIVSKVVREINGNRRFAYIPRADI